MLRNVSISTRIIGIIVVMLLVIAGILFSLFFTAKGISDSGTEMTGEIMLEGKKEMIVLGTQTMAVALGKALAGVTDRQEQHDIIKSYIQDYRFEEDKSGYYFTYIGTTIFMHPTLPQREGEDLGNTPDANGVFYVRDLYENAKKGGGFVNFDFPKPPSMDIATKWAYVEYIPGTDIWISTGVYIDMINVEKARIKEMHDAVLKTRMTVIMGVILAILVLFLVPLCFLIFRSITKPLNDVARSLELIALGDLTIAMPEKGKDEISKMTRFFNQTTLKIKEMVTNIRKDTLTLSNVGNDLAGNMTETAAAVREISANIQSVKNRMINQSASVTETNATMEQITHNLNRLNDQVEKQTTSVAKSSSAIEQMLANIESVTQTLIRNGANVTELTDASEVGRSGLQEVASNIQEISRESEGLLEINAVMENIASQTNLLSMNAAIEAAHAGEAGKGFAVVADEIRKLATNSSEQSKTINSVLKKIKQSIDKISVSTDNVLRNFEAIDSKVRIVAEQEENIRNAMEEQSQGSKQVLESVSLVNEVTLNVKAESTEMIKGSREVIREAGNLEKVTQEMTVGMNEMAEGAKEIDIAINRVNDLSGRNQSSIENLVKEVSHFKV